MATKFTSEEPQPRLITISLSQSEVAALIQWHLKVARGTPKRLGKIAIEKQYSIPALHSLRNLAVQQMASHKARIKELLKLIES